MLDLVRLWPVVTGVIAAAVPAVLIRCCWRKNKGAAES